MPRGSRPENPLFRFPGFVPSARGIGWCAPDEIDDARARLCGHAKVQAAPSSRLRSKRMRRHLDFWGFTLGGIGMQRCRTFFFLMTYPDVLCMVMNQDSCKRCKLQDPLSNTSIFVVVAISLAPFGCLTVFRFHQRDGPSGYSGAKGLRISIFPISSLLNYGEPRSYLEFPRHLILWL